jgi:hypothetical protein
MFHVEWQKPTGEWRRYLSLPTQIAAELCKQRLGKMVVTWGEGECPVRVRVEKVVETVVPMASEVAMVAETFLATLAPIYPVADNPIVDEDPADLTLLAACPAVPNPAPLVERASRPSDPGRSSKPREKKRR